MYNINIININIININIYAGGKSAANWLIWYIYIYISLFNYILGEFNP